MSAREGVSSSTRAPATKQIRPTWRTKCRTNSRRSVRWNGWRAGARRWKSTLPLAKVPRTKPEETEAPTVDRETTRMAPGSPATEGQEPMRTRSGAGKGRPAPAAAIHCIHSGYIGFVEEGDSRPRRAIIRACTKDQSGRGPDDPGRHRSNEPNLRGAKRSGIRRRETPPCRNSTTAPRAVVVGWGPTGLPKEPATRENG